MIITSDKKLEPGKYYDEKFFGTPFGMLDNIYQKYKFLVIKECTLQEYRNEVNRLYSKEKADRILNYEYFYEIHSD